MLKLILIATEILCIVYIGHVIKSFFYNRIVYYKDLVVLCHRLQNNLDFNRVKLKTFFDSNLDDLVIKNDVMNVVNDKEISTLYLSNNEKNNIKQFISTLGQYDIVGEKSNIGNAKTNFEEQEKRCQEMYDKYGVLSFKLAFILSLVIAILLL